MMLRALELDPVQVGERVMARGAHCEFGTPRARSLARAIHKIDKLLHPASIGLIGVSATSMNFGRIILRNLMGSRIPKERLLVIQPGAARSTACDAWRASTRSIASSTS